MRGLTAQVGAAGTGKTTMLGELIKVGSSMWVGASGQEHDPSALSNFGDQKRGGQAVWQLLSWSLPPVSAPKGA